jgi:hypothetical protein
MSPAHCCSYPQFTILQMGQQRRVSEFNAARAVAEDEATLGEIVLDSDGTTHPISEEERQHVLQAAQEWQQQ